LPLNNKASKTSRLTLLIVILTICVGCDRITKQIAADHLQQAGIVSFLGDTFRLHYIENPGAFLGLGDMLAPTLRFWLFTVFNGGILIVLAAWLIANHKLMRIEFIAFALILAGGIGNQIDRIFNQGHVIDFINIGIGSLRTGIFNVADMAVTGGVVLMIGFMFQYKKNRTISD